MKNKIKELGIGTVAIILLGVLAQFFFPWWSIAVVGFIVGFLIRTSSPVSFAYGTSAVTLLWLTYAIIQSSINGGIMGTAISDMAGGKITTGQLIVFSSVIGGLVGGFSTMSGTLLRQLIKAS